MLYLHLLGSLTHLAFLKENSLLLASLTLIPVRWQVPVLRGTRATNWGHPITSEGSRVSISSPTLGTETRVLSPYCLNSHRMCKSRHVWLSTAYQLAYSTGDCGGNR